MARAGIRDCGEGAGPERTPGENGSPLTSSVRTCASICGSLWISFSLMSRVRRLRSSPTVSGSSRSLLSAESRTAQLNPPKPLHQLPARTWGEVGASLLLQGACQVLRPRLCEEEHHGRVSVTWVQVLTPPLLAESLWKTDCTSLGQFSHL